MARGNPQSAKRSTIHTPDHNSLTNEQPHRAEQAIVLFKLLEKYSYRKKSLKIEFMKNKFKSFLNVLYVIYRCITDV